MQDSTSEQTVTKVCRKCGNPRPLDQYSKDGKSPDGLNYWCKPCWQKHRSQNKEYRRRYNQEWRKNNPEGTKQQAKRYSIKHASKESLRVAQWKAQNPERVRHQARVHRATHLWKYREHYHRRKAALKRAIAQLTKQEWEWLLGQSGNCCVYCGRHESECGKLQQEHVIPVSKGGAYTVTNIVPSCRSCNSRKKDRTPDEAGMVFAVQISPLEHMKQTSLFEDDKQ